MIPPRVAIFDKTYSPIAAKFAPAFESFTVIVEGFAASSGIIATSGLTFAAYGGLTARASLSGTSFLVLNSTGNIIGRAYLNGSAGLSLNATATITAQFASGLYGTVALQFAVAGALKGKASIAGAGIVSFLPATTLTAKARFASAVTISIQAGGAVRGMASLSGASAVQFTGAATLSAVQPGLYGSAGIVFAQSATARGIASAILSVSISFTQSATVRGKSSISGSSTLAFTQSATLGLRVAINGASTIAFAPAGAIRGTARSTAPSVLNFTQTGAIKGRGRFTGTSAATFTPAASIANAAGSGLVTVSFTTVAGTFALSGSGWGGGPGYGITTKTLPASTAGGIQSDFNGTGNNNAWVGFDIDNTLRAYTSGPGVATGIFVNSLNNNFYYLNGTSAVNSGIAAATGDKIRIWRTAPGAVTAEYSRNGGTTWNLVFDYSTIYGTYTAVLYPKGEVISATNYILNPKGTNII